jgi:hypothetical protein
MNFFKSQKFQEAKYSMLQTILAHQNVLDMGMSIARSVSGFAQSKSPLSFVEGGVAAFNTGVKIISGDSESFFSTINGWETLAASYTQQALYDILSSGIESFPKRQFKFAYETDKTMIYTLPVGTLGRTKRAIYFRSSENNRNDILRFIMKEKMNGGNSKMVTIVEESKTGSNGYPAIKFDLKPEESIAIPSKTAADLSSYLERYIAKGLPRSIILNGLPGTGKSTMAHKVFQDLNLNTLKFKYSKNTNASVMGIISFLLETFEIEAVLLDDFDYFSETTSMLEFLEWLHRHTKVVIAITNSLKSFPPAVLRPGRFDELRTIEYLDDQVIKGVLGDLYDSFADKVNKWPIAYINELAIRVQTNPDANPQDYIDELQGRINTQIKTLKGG